MPQSSSASAAGLVDGALFGALVAGGVLGALLGLPVSRWLATRVEVARTVFALLVAAVGVYILFK